MERSVGFRRVLWGIGGAAAMIATGVGVRAFAGPAGSALTYTGCLHKNGTIVDVALGDQPASPCDTKGTVHVGAGDITAVNTPVGGGLRGGGTSGDVSLSLAPIPAARVKASTPITVPDNTLTVLPLDFEELDTANLHNPADNTRISAPVAGIYTVSAHVSWPQNSQGSRDIYIDATIGIAFQVIASSSMPGSGAGQAEQSISTIVQLSAGDSVELQVRQTSGGPELVEDSDHSPTLTMAWLGPSS